MTLTGRSAIITGANQGLGRSIATSFVQCGADVLLVARNGQRLGRVREELLPLARPGQTVEIMSADVSQPASCENIVRRALEVLPALSILVNNAGVVGPMGRLEDVDWQAWMEAVQINLFGTVLMCRAVIPCLRKQGHGKIINLSGGGATAPFPRMTAYAASKVAVVRFTESLAEELREAQVDVNAIAPGALNTQMLDQVLAAGADKVGQEYHDKAVKQRREGGSPPEKAAALAVFLASPASDGITGRLISAVWDDWASLPRQRARLAKSDVYTLRRIVPDDRKEKW